MNQLHININNIIIIKSKPLSIIKYKSTFSHIKRKKHKNKIKNLKLKYIK